MKKMKKLVSLLLAMVMVFAMTVTTFAANITINGGASEAQYSAYKLLNATDGGNGKYAYTVNSKYEQVLKNVTGKETEAEIIEYISDLNAEGVRVFADSVYAEIKNAGADASSSENIFSNVDQGYYLIAETSVGTNPDGATDTFSLVMLDTAGEDDISVTTKEDKPSLNKQIKHNESDSWGVVGDNQIGDTVEFRTITTVPQYTENYTSYDYIIHDTMSIGLTSNVRSAADITVKVNDETELNNKYITSVTVAGNTFNIKIDVKQAIADKVMTSGDELYTYYSGVLNGGAVIYSEGKQDNEAYLEYSNNPYDTNGKGETPKKKVYDWTFKMGVEKIDGVTKEQLRGAKFVLTKDGSLTVPTLSEEGTLSSTENLLGFVVVDDTYRLATSEDTSDSVVYVIEAGDTTIKGLDDATDYYLYEVKAPAGYNLLKDPVKFKITASYNEDGSAYESVNVEVDDEQPSAELKTQVENNSGTELPETGGIGTTIFYVIGAILVLGAGILLVTKKRMGADK